MSERLMTEDDFDMRLGVLEERIVETMSARTRRVYLAFKEAGGNFADVIDVYVEEVFDAPTTSKADLDEHLAKIFETFLTDQ